MPATGPDFISLQVRDIHASQAFYEQHLGLVRSEAGPPHAPGDRVSRGADGDRVGVPSMIPGASARQARSWRVIR